MTAPKSQIEPARARGEKARSARWGLGFWSLIVTQFQGAFNDNALKFLVIYIIVDMGLPGPKRDWLVLVVGALFALPFILFSMTGGYLADRFSKRSVTIGTKWMEVAVMLFALLALGRGNLPMEAAGVFLLSSQGALFGPSKYGLLPETSARKGSLLGQRRNRAGDISGVDHRHGGSGYLAFYFRGQQHWSGVLLLALHVDWAWRRALAITRVPAANPTRKIQYQSAGRSLGANARDPQRPRADLGHGGQHLSVVSGGAAAIHDRDLRPRHSADRRTPHQLPASGRGRGHRLRAAWSPGIFPDGKIEYGLIPLGAAGMTVFGFLSAEPWPLARTRGGLSRSAGIFWRLLRRAAERVDPAPARSGATKAA